MSNSDFYTKEDSSQGIKEGWIADPNLAETVAYAEKSEGRDEALKVENSLSVDGLMPNEKENVDAVNLLVKEFPNIFDERIDKESGERYYVTSPKLLFQKFTGLASKSLGFQYVGSPEYHQILDKYEKKIYQLSENTDGSNNFMGIFDGSSPKYVRDNALLALSQHGIGIVDIHYSKVSKGNSKDISEISENHLTELLKAFSVSEAYAEEVKDAIERNAGKRLTLDDIRAKIDNLKDEAGNK